jgi:hypothetical protein
MVEKRHRSNAICEVRTVRFSLSAESVANTTLTNQPIIEYLVWTEAYGGKIARTCAAKFRRDARWRINTAFPRGLPLRCHCSVARLIVVRLGTLRMNTESSVAKPLVSGFRTSMQDSEQVSGVEVDSRFRRR